MPTYTPQPTAVPKYIEVVREVAYFVVATPTPSQASALAAQAPSPMSCSAEQAAAGEC